MLMSSYTNAIEFALENGPRIYLDQGMPDDGPNLNLEESCRGTNDHTPIHWNVGGMESDSNDIVVSTFKELKALQDEVASVADFNNKAKLKNNLRHEYDHALVAKALNAGNIALGMTVWKAYDTETSPTYTIAFQPFMRPSDVHASKLEIATMIAHPMHPSKGDIRDLNAMGYDIDEVGYKATQHNLSNRVQMLVPRSYASKNRIHIPLSWTPLFRKLRSSDGRATEA
jgi:hypothetical protein